ncbi:MAG: DUF6186 family protein [Acidimicrobiales bacterium]
MSTRAVTLAGYVVILGAALVLSAIARARARAALSDAVLRVLCGRAGRIVVLASWAWLGWHLFARGSGAFD